MDAPLFPTKVFQVNGQTLGITWSDGAEREYVVRTLRQECPCAHCVSEDTGKRILDPESVAANVHPREMTQVGHYGLRIVWSDGHQTGIFPYRRLHGMGRAVGEV